MRGMSLIEVLVILAILGVLTSIAMTGFGMATGNSTISFGINGMTEVRCIDGYKFVVGDQGQARQILDEFGKGARCNNGSM